MSRNSSLLCVVGALSIHNSFIKQYMQCDLHTHKNNIVGGLVGGNDTIFVMELRHMLSNNWIESAHRPIEFLNFNMHQRPHILHPLGNSIYVLFSTFCLFPSIKRVSDIRWSWNISLQMVTFHYVKLYVSNIIHLKVININVRNFNFLIGFYSNNTPFEPPLPQSWKLSYQLETHIYNSTKFHEILSSSSSDLPWTPSCRKDRKKGE